MICIITQLRGNNAAEDHHSVKTYLLSIVLLFSFSVEAEEGLTDETAMGLDHTNRDVFINNVRTTSESPFRRRYMIRGNQVEGVILGLVRL